MTRILIHSLKDLERFAKKFAKTLRGGEVIALTGPLGAGKTTFVQMLGKALGVSERITSPTFTLMHLHKTSGERSAVDGGRVRLLVHIDAYRLNPRDLVGIGALDYLGRADTVAVVEWGEKVRRVLPKGARWIRFSIAKDGRTRTVRLSGFPPARE